MPTSRPASPASASLTGIASVVNTIYLVDAVSGSTIPDLLGGNALSVTNAVYTTDAVIGKSLRSSGSGIQAATNAGDIISSYPFSGGCIFTSAGVSGANNGLFSLIDSAGDRQSGGLFAICYYDSTGAVYLTWRVLAGDSPYGVTGIGSLNTDGTINAIGYRVDGKNAITICVNGSISHTVFQAANDASFDVTFRLEGTSILGDVNFTQTTTSFDCDTHLNMALMWRAHGSNPTDSQIQTWSADPWSILAGASGSNGGAADTLANASQVSAGALAISGHLT